MNTLRHLWQLRASMSWIVSIHLIGWILALSLSPFTPRGSVTVALIALFMSLSLFYLILWLFSVVRTRVPVAGHLMLILYNLLLVSAWAFRIRTGRFPTVEDLCLLDYLVHAYTVLVVEPLVAVVALSLAALAGVGSVVISREIARCQEFARHPLWSVALVIVVSLIVAAPKFAIPSLVAPLPEAAFVSGLRQYQIGTLADWYNPTPVIQAPSAPSDISGRSVLIISIEALRRDMITARQADGRPLMPFLASLVERGNAYARAYAQASDSEMSMFAVLTGRYPAQSLLRPEFKPELGLLSALQGHGYQTAYFSIFVEKWGRMGARIAQYHSDPANDGGAIDLSRSIAEQTGVEPHPQEVVFKLDELNVRRFDDWVSQRDPSTSLGIFFVLYGSHFPYSGELGREMPRYYFTRSEAARVRREYEKSLTRADGLVARLFTSMLRKDPNAIIVVTGDHGEEFYEHDGYLHAGALSAEVMNVPLIISGLPKSCLRPTSVARPVGHIDIVPTILALLNIPQDLSTQGIDLCEQTRVERPLFSSSRAFRLQDAVIVADKKYILSHDGAAPEAYDLRSNVAEVDPQDVRSEHAMSSFNMLSAFRAAQKKYYSLPGYERYTPPQYNDSFLAIHMGEAVK